MEDLKQEPFNFSRHKVGRRDTIDYLYNNILWPEGKTPRPTPSTATTEDDDDEVGNDGGWRLDQVVLPVCYGRSSDDIMGPRQS